MKQFTTTFAASSVLSGLLGHLIGFYVFNASVSMVMFSTALVLTISAVVVMTAKEIINENN
jgi:hypothetical protein